MGAIAVASRRLGDDVTMHVALMLVSVFLVTGNRFLPGSIDHHNVQLVLVAIIAAGLLDPERGAAGHALAGFAAAVAIAIGVETTPFIAVACVAVGVLWAVKGIAYAKAARAFSLTLLVGLSFIFFATVPPIRYAVVTCDSLSIGFYAVVGIGAASLFVATRLPGMLDGRMRFLALGVIGTLVAIGAWVIAPQCLQNPLNELDPLLQSLWLAGVSEAQSALNQFQNDPASFGAVYAVGFFAICTCLFRIINSDRALSHVILLALIGVSYCVALVQVRGAIFVNLLAIPPLALLIGELRNKARAEPERLGTGLLFALTAFLSVPSAWALFGVLAIEGTGGVMNRLKSMDDAGAVSSQSIASCKAPAGFATLAALPAGDVVAGSDFGPDILRFTHHRALSAPYHRNQGGMLTELHIGLAQPSEAEAFLRGSGVEYLLFCPNFAQTRTIAEMKPDGLYAGMLKGEIPSYLRPVPVEGPSGMQIYRVELP
jgi:hypothetical protein